MGSDLPVDTTDFKDGKDQYTTEWWNPQTSFMLRFLLNVAFLLFACSGVSAQCPTNLVITSDRDVVNFQRNYPNCSRLKGSLTISGTRVRNLKPLSQLTLVGRDVLIEDLALKSITGLQNIRSVGGNFTLRDCAYLSGDGFPDGLALSSIGKSLTLQKLPRLTEMLPLKYLTQLKKELIVSDTRVERLSPLTRLQNALTLLELSSNAALTDISALDNISSIAYLTITGNRTLNDCAIASVCANLTVPGNATISGNAGGCATVPVVEFACSSCTHPDYPALESFYNSTGGSGWTNNDGWLMDCDPCSWYGVGCENGRVNELSLISNDLRGLLPSALGNLPFLQFLYLSNNSLIGSIPSNFAGLDYLEDIYLNSLSLTGGIPQYFADMETLRYVNLANNNLSGHIPYTIGGFDLVYLNLSDNNLTGPIPEYLGDFLTIETVLLQNNNLTGSLPDEYGYANNLNFNVRNNDLSGCYPESYRGEFCYFNQTGFFGNPGLPDGGSADYFENVFCSIDYEGCEPVAQQVGATTGEDNQVSSTRQEVVGTKGRNKDTQVSLTERAMGNSTTNFPSKTIRPSVSPNPSSGIFAVYASSAQTLVLYAADGRVVQKIQHGGQGWQTITEPLNSGIYWCRFTGSGEVLKAVVR